VTPPEPASAELPPTDRFDDASPPKKLLRDHDPPWPPLEDPRGAHPVPVCGNDGAAMPAPVGWQLSPGISA